MKHFNVLILLLSVSSCGFLEQRDFVDEMEREPDSYFVPKQDFRTVPGDEGDPYVSNDEVIMRTPASYSTRMQRNYNRSLQDELLELEQAQSEGAYAHYSKYKRALGGTSEKIYFLRLRTINERERFLVHRGLKRRSMYTAGEEKLAVRNNEVLLGMDMSKVRQSWGDPTLREVAGRPDSGNERWAYQKHGRTKFIYFENGVVAGWSFQ